MKIWSEYRISELLKKQIHDTMRLVWDASNSMSKRLGDFNEKHKEPNTWTPPDVEFNDLEDLRHHAWFGNHYFDQKAFAAADRLFCKYVECGEFNKAKESSNIVVRNGMGIEDSPEITDDFMFEMYEMNVEGDERHDV